MSYLLKAVRRLPDGSVESKPFTCPHFSIREMADEWVEIEFPQVAEDGSQPITSLIVPDDWDAVYQMNPTTGDTIDSWKVKSDGVSRKSRESRDA